MGSALQTLSKPQVSRRCPRRASPLSGWRLGPFSKGVLSSRHSRQSGFEQATRTKTGEGVYWRNETVGGMGKGDWKDGAGGLEKVSPAISVRGQQSHLAGGQCRRPRGLPLCGCSRVCGHV